MSPLQSANLNRSDLSNADLRSADLSGANLIGANNLTPSKIKSACNWEKAFYEGNLDEDKQEWMVNEKANQDYIKLIKQYKVSNPPELVDCRPW